MIAYHEAGHAMTARLIENADPLSKVTIIPRGQSLGATEQIPEEERHNLGKQYLENRLAIILGGRASEKNNFKDITTGAGDDLKKATQLARRMVCQWGMSDKLGPVTFQQGEPHPFLGREMTQQKDFSEYTAQLIDQEIQNMVKNAEQVSIDILKANKSQLDNLANALLEHETLDNKDIDDLFGHTDETIDL